VGKSKPQTEQELAECIERALLRLRTDYAALLSHVPDPISVTPSYAGRTREAEIPRDEDTRDLWQWVTQDLRLVLKALGQEKSTAERFFARTLPEPYPRPDYRVYRRTLTKSLQDEYDRLAAEDERHEQERIEGARRGLLAEKEAEKRNIAADRAAGRDCRQAEARLAQIEDGINRMEVIRAEWDAWNKGENYSNNLRPGRHDPRWSAALQAEVAKLAAPQAAAEEKWERTFFECPAVWLWGVWTWFNEFTGLKAPSGVPEWPQGKHASRSVIQDYMGVLAGGLSGGLFKAHDGTCPAKAANLLEQGLVQLRALLADDKTGDTPPPETEAALSKEALALAALTDHPGWTDEQIATAAGCNAKSLYRMKKFKNAKALLKEGKDDMPRGSN
jgi:hypothetical protein